jgi:hypothetical protein
VASLKSSPSARAASVRHSEVQTNSDHPRKSLKSAGFVRSYECQAFETGHPPSRSETIKQKMAHMSEMLGISEHAQKPKVSDELMLPTFSTRPDKKKKYVMLQSIF